MSENVGSDKEPLWILMVSYSIDSRKKKYELSQNIQSRSMSDPTFSDNDFKNEMSLDNP